MFHNLFIKSSSLNRLFPVFPLVNKIYTAVNIYVQIIISTYEYSYTKIVKIEIFVQKNTYTF